MRGQRLQPSWRTATIVLAALSLGGCAGSDQLIQPPADPSLVPGEASDDQGPAGPSAQGPAQRVLKPLNGVFGPGSVWEHRVDALPVSEQSEVQVAGLTGSLSKLYGGIAAFNVYEYGMSWYTVSAAQERVTVRFDNCQDKPATPAELYGPGGQFVDVPIPDDAQPMAGTDGELTIYQPSTDTLWDFWRAARDNRGWRACWGGRIDKVSSGIGRFPSYFLSLIHI